jgi:hypothetical protein
MVGLYLQKLSLFKLMPFDMLMEIAGRLTSAHYPKGSISKILKLLNIKFASKEILEIVCISSTGGKLMFKFSGNQ